MSDSGDIFPFQPTTRNQSMLSQRVSNYFQQQESDVVETPCIPKKKKENDMCFSFIKTPKRGSKIIRLEIYDLDKFEESPNLKFCECNAKTCTQYVVDSDNLLFDDIYNSAKNLIVKIHKSMDKL
ncbi:hypothetical protein ACJJTC_005427 [Scirpophaga incertulas]